MTIEFGWADTHQSVFEIVLQPGWTWRDFNNAIVEVVEMLKSVEHPVYLIFNYSNCYEVPMGGNAFGYTTQAITYLPPNIQMIVAVSRNPFVQMMFDSFKRVLVSRFSQRIYHDYSVEEAYRRIERNMVQQVSS